MLTGKVTSNFSWYEFIPDWYDHSDILPNQIVAMRCLAMYVLQPIRDFLGRPVEVTSCLRNVEYNRIIHGAPDSQHLYGEAADIRVAGLTPDEILRRLPESVTQRIFKLGVYDTHLHVSIPSCDVLNHPHGASWSG